MISFRSLNVFNIPPSDPTPLPFTHSPVPVILIISSYLLFVLKIGKSYMQNRQPFNVKNIILVYNVMQVIYNGMVFVIALNWMFKVYDLKCMEALPQDHPKKNIERLCVYLYFINKIMDLADTIFFVLRKSYKQITFLHLYHHVLMVVGGYSYIRFYGYGGHVTIMGIMNTFVHIIMYTYYFLSALSPKVKSSLWWKKYITILQLTQFVMIFVHTVYALIFKENCGYPMILFWLSLLQSVHMIYMFSNFYVHAYIRPKQQQRKGSKSK